MINLQAALFSVLDNALSVPVYDAVPQAIDSGDDAEFPYITIGDDSFTEFDTDTSEGFDTETTVHVWSRYRGRSEVKELQQLIYDALHLQTIAVQGQHFVMALFQNATSFVDADGLTRHGVITFRIVTEDE